MDKEKMDKSNKRSAVIRYRELIDFVRTIATTSGIEDKDNKINQKIKSLAKAKLKCSIRAATPWNLKSEMDIIREYMYPIMRLASDYVQYSKFNNYYANQFYLRKFNESCEKLAAYLEIDLSPETEDRIYEKDFLENIDDPLTDDNLKKYVEVFYLGDEKYSYYSNLMKENSCDDKLNQEDYRAMRKMVFVSEIENMLKKNDEEHHKKSRRYKVKYIVNELLEPFYIIGRNKREYLNNKSYYSVMQKDIISDLRKYVDMYGKGVLVDIYNEIRSNLDENGKYWESLDEEHKKIYWLVDYIRASSHNLPGILSFFIERRMFDDKWKYRADDGIDIRYYINIDGDNIYKFTEEYVRNAIEQGIPFDIKVVDAEKGEDDRTERLVIYSSFETMQKNLDILRKIRITNPDMEYGKPPITVATIDDWIGFGSEPKSISSSYNIERAKLLKKAIEEVFGKRGNEEKGKAIIEDIDKNPSLLEKLRNKIRELAESFNISEDHFFLDKEDEEYFAGRSGRYVFSKCEHVENFTPVQRKESAEKSRRKDISGRNNQDR